MALQTILGLGIIRGSQQSVLAYQGGVSHYAGCFFDHVGTAGLELMPQLNIVDMCNTFDLDSNEDIMPEVYPAASGHFQIDSNGDIIPEIV